MTYIYPTSDLDRPQRLIAMLGSVWTDRYSGRDVVDALATTQTMLAGQCQNDIQAAADLLSRQDMPVALQQEFVSWQPLLSQLQTTPTGEYYLPAPVGFYTIPWISDQLSNPVVLLQDGLDYRLVNDQIWFAKNPFYTYPATTALYSGGKIVDEQLQLWLGRPRLDRNLVYQHLGYLLNIPTPSTEQARRFLNVYAAAIEGGTTRSHIEQLVALNYDVPIGKTDGELVVQLAKDRNFQWVITDRDAYRCHLDSTLVVQVGDVLTKNCPLTQDYVWAWPAAEVSPLLTQLTLPLSILTAGFIGPLQATNVSQAVAITEASGALQVTFPLSGAPADVALFWAMVAANTATYGYSLADCLLSHGGIPGSINPVTWLLQNVFRQHAVVIRVNTAHAGPDALGLDLEVLLPQVLPPKTLLLLEL